MGDLVAGPDLATDVDRVAGAPERFVERHAVPALDDLRPRGAAERERPPDSASMVAALCAMSAGERE